MLRTADLEFELPEERIATRPTEPRDAARMMVISRSDPGLLEHAVVRDIGNWLKRGDVMVVNGTRVIPARFAGKRMGTGGRTEGLYLRDAGAADGMEAGKTGWIALLRAGHLRAGVEVALENEAGRRVGVVLRLVRLHEEEPGAWVVEVAGGDAVGPALLERVGRTPLPPYILQARKHTHVEVADGVDRERYQTVYAHGAGGGEPAVGSVAAPTAGLHFTPELLGRLEEGGVTRLEVTLHVGTGTFRAVETEFVEQHRMHREWCTMPGATREAIVRARREGRRVFCVGTTAARTVESHARAVEERGWLETEILITPGFAWEWTDGLLTNFHLPRSTLLALVAGFLGKNGLERLKRHYAEAVERGYRFFSYGDAMLILP